MRELGRLFGVPCVEALLAVAVVACAPAPANAGWQTAESVVAGKIPLTRSL